MNDVRCICDDFPGANFLCKAHPPQNVTPAPHTAYHVVRDDLRDAFAALGLRLVHEDGTEPGKSCFGYLVGRLHEASKRWHDPLIVGGREIHAPRCVDCNLDMTGIPPWCFAPAETDEAFRKRFPAGIVSPLCLDCYRRRCSE